MASLVTTRPRKKGRRPPARPAHDTYVEAVLGTLARRRLAAAPDRVLVAVSGGPDSSALLAALARLRDAGALAAVAALHVDHGLRPGGDEDAAWCHALCDRLGVPFRSVRVSVAPGNVQASARAARYQALKEEAARLDATRVATGHTRTDQAETVLLRLVRGAGARGLSGIPARRGRIIRPLIDRSREEGLAFLARAGLAWREDPTNATPTYARNRVRLQLWPLLLALNPEVEAALARTADLLRDDERALARLARAAAGGRGGADVARLRGEARAVRRRVVRRLARAAGGAGPAPAAGHVEAALQLLRPGGPPRAGLPGGLEAVVEGGRLRVRAAGGEAPPAVAPVRLDGPGRYLVPALGLVAEVEAPAAVAWPLWLRTRRAGDRFRPARGRGSKSLKAWLIDRKVARDRRDRLLLLVDGAGAVLAIPELGAQGAGLPAGLAVRVAPGP